MPAPFYTTVVDNVTPTGSPFGSEDVMHQPQARSLQLPLTTQAPTTPPLRPMELVRDLPPRIATIPNSRPDLRPTHDRVALPETTPGSESQSFPLPPATAPEPRSPSQLPEPQTPQGNALVLPPSPGTPSRQETSLPEPFNAGRSFMALPPVLSEPQKPQLPKSRESQFPLLYDPLL